MGLQVETLMDKKNGIPARFGELISWLLYHQIYADNEAVVRFISKSISIAKLTLKNHLALYWCAQEDEYITSHVSFSCIEQREWFPSSIKLSDNN